jgi:hypothetical protein
VVARVCRRFRLLSGFCRFRERRVDFRDGRDFESSSAYEAFFAAAFDRLRAAVEPAPAFRSVALTPGFAVSTGVSRRGRFERLGLFGPERSI